MVTAFGKITFYIWSNMPLLWRKDIVKISALLHDYASIIDNYLYPEHHIYSGT